MWTAKVVLDVTAKIEKGNKVFSYQKIWQEIGTDLNGDQQFKAWEIKNTIDLALQPRQKHTETLTIEFPEATTSAEIEATLTYQHRPGQQFVVHRVVRKPSFPR
jgi:hypothetical protein